MTKTINDKYSGGAAGEFTILEPIESEDWRELFRDQNRLWGDKILRLGGRVSSSSTALQTATTPTPVDDFFAAGLHARELNQTNLVELLLKFWCEDAQITAEALDMSDVSVDTDSGTQSSFGLLELQLDLTSADLSGPIAVYASMRKDLTEASLWGFEVLGRFLRAGDEALLPDGS